MKQSEALGVLGKYIKSPNLVKHGITVSAVMRHFAKLEGENEEFWAVAGLLHDIDWEMYPDEHCVKSREILKKEGLCDKTVRAAVSHGFDICQSDIEPLSYMENVLYTTDELTGLIIACALVKPERRLETVDLDTVQRKWGKKEFARGANREVIEKGAKRMNKPLDYVIEETLTAMKSIAGEIGL